MKRNQRGYYTTERRKARTPHTPGSRRRVALGFVDWIVVAITVAAAVALVAGLLAKVVDPQWSPLFAFAGLMYQITYVVCLGCALWWVIRWRRWFFVSLVALVLGLGNIGLFYRSDMRSKAPEVVRSKDDLVVASFNVAGFTKDYSKEDVDPRERVAEWLTEEGATVVCLQESYFGSVEQLEDMKQMCGRIGYAKFVSSIPELRDARSGGGFTILSTYPIVRHGVADEDENNVNAIWADLKIGRDTIRVFNVHLQSTGIDREERHQTLTAQIIDDTLAGAKLSKVARKMADNYRQRATEAKNLALSIDSSPHPIVVCGDFNDPPASYTYRTVRQGRLADAFVECGRGIDYTFKGLYNLFRIDYILPDEEHFEVKSYASHDVGLSDHKAVVARLSRIEN